MRQDYFTQDHYRVLGVAPDASHGTIREAYLRLVKKHHPDVSKGVQNEDKFKAVASAWEVMGDKSKRALYDERMGDPAFRRRTEQRRRAQGAGGRNPRPGGAGHGRTQMPPILRAFEFATHPRVLMIGIPLALAGYMIFGDRDTQQPTSIKVDAWHNPRWIEASFTTHQDVQLWNGTRKCFSSTGRRLLDTKKIGTFSLRPR